MHTEGCPSKSTAPDFTLNGTTWQCWVVEGGAYEWRSTCGRYAVWRDGKAFRARRGQTSGRFEYPTIKEAMWAAMNGRGAVAA